MIGQLRGLFSPAQTRDDALTRLQASFIRLLAIIQILAAIAGIITQLIVGSGVYAVVFTAAVAVICLGILLMLRFGHVRAAAVVLVALLTIAALQAGSVATNIFLFLATVALISAGLLVDMPAFILVNCLIFARYTMALWPLTGFLTGSEPAPELTSTIVVGMTLFTVSSVTRYFVDVLQKSTLATQRNAVLLQATNHVGQIATSLLDLNELFNRSVELIKERFGFYHVQVFMVNGDQAELVASTGEPGKRLLANKHKLPVGSNSVIGYVTRYGEPVIARSTDAVHRFNPLLPDTKTELAVPIFEDNKVIGALDMQSTQVDAFRLEDVEALRSMANLLAAAIRNARLFESQERSIKEQQRVYLESEANLREIQRLNRQLTKAGWDDFLKQSKQSAGVTLQNAGIVSDNQWTDTLIEAAQRRQVVTRAANGHPGVVAVPVVLRGEVIGAIEVETSDSLQRDAVETVQAIAQRLATSLENARLYEEAQAATVQEQRINQIVTRYQAATNVDDLLRITLTELSEALGAQRGAIRLGIIPETGGENS